MSPPPSADAAHLQLQGKDALYIGARRRSRTPAARAEDKVAPPSPQASKPPAGAKFPTSSTSTRISWVSRIRHLGCAANLSVVLVTYLEYLWAAEWVDDDAKCKATALPSTSFDLMEFLECLRRFTYSDSMVRGNNMFWFSVIGSFAATVYISVEHRRIQGLAEDLKEQLQTMESEPEDGSSRVRWSMSCLKVYKAAILSSFVLVLGLAPCHIDRPLLHYPLAGTMFFLMAVGMSAYVLMPLDFGNATTCKIKAWNARRWRIMPIIRMLFTTQLVALLSGVLRLIAVLTASSWANTSGRLFGIMEVSIIVGYQVWVALLAVDDSHIDHTTALFEGVCKSAEEISRTRPVILDGMLISG